MQAKDHDETISTIMAMRQQEHKTYFCETSCHGENDRPPMDDETSSSSSSAGVDATTPKTRQIFCDWCYKIVDFCELDRELVEIAMNHVDRFVQTEKGRSTLRDASRYQMLVVTALYTSVKTNSEFAISIKQFERISRDCFTAKDLEEMERLLLEVLQWHMNPPTSLSFVRLFLDLIPKQSMNQDLRDTAYILARIQTELSVFDSRSISAKSSTIAFASLMNSFEVLGLLETLSGSAAVQSFVSKAASLGLVDTQLFYTEGLLASIQARLYQAIANQENPTSCVGQNGSKAPSRRGVARNKSFEESPRSVISRTA